MRWIVTTVAVLCNLGVIFSLPPSLVDDVKANELKQSNKVKRAFNDETASEENQKVSTFSSAIKRGSSQLFPDWQQDKNLDESSDSSDYSQFDGKPSFSDVEKNYQYNAQKEKIDEALENAILKSEYYREPNPSQYRYYEDQYEERRRKRRDAKVRMGNRNKRNIELSPEEWLALLQIWENDRRHAQKDPYHPIWSTYDSNQDKERDRVEYDLEDDDENWLEAPVYPHIGRAGEISKGNSNYLYEDKRGQWDGFSENKKKRYNSLSERRSDPSSELRYLNGPARSKNEFYTLSQLLASQREPNYPVYRRLIL